MTAGVSAALATLTRLQGVAILVPLAFEYVRREGIRLPRTAREAVGLAAVPASALVYLAVRSLAGAEVIPTREPQLFARLVAPWENLLYSLQTIASGRFHQADLLNLAAFVLFALLTVLAWQRLPHRYTLYMAALQASYLVWFPPQMPLVSMTRHVLLFFPGFWLLAERVESASAQWLVLVPSTGPMICLTALFALGEWVG